MGTTIEDLWLAFSKINLEEQLPVIIQQSGKEITDKIKTQLEKGELSTGAKITPAYKSKYYAAKKQKMNQMPGYGIPDIKLTGNFYNKLEVDVPNKDDYEIESQVDYANEDSLTQYGPDLIRLSDQSREELIEETIHPALQQYITDLTGLKFE